MIFIFRLKCPSPVSTGLTFFVQYLSLLLSVNVKVLKDPKVYFSFLFSFVNTVKSLSR